MSLSELIESLNHCEKDPDATAEEAVRIGNEISILARTLKGGRQARAYAEAKRASDLMDELDQSQFEEKIYGTYEQQGRATYYGSL